MTGYSVGALWTSSDVIAPFNFRLLKDQTKYRNEVSKSLENYYPVFVLDTSAKHRSIESLNFLFSSLAVSPDSSRQNKDSLQKMLSVAELSSDEITLVTTYLTGLQPVTAKEVNPAFDRLITPVTKLYDKDYFYNNIPSEYQAPERKIALRKRANTEEITTVSELLSFETAKNHLTEVYDKSLRLKSEVRNALIKLVASTLIPNIAYDQDASEQSRKVILSRVPKTEGIILEGQKIIGKGEVITPEAKTALESLSEARIEQGGTAALVGRALGTIGQVFIIVSLFVLYLKFIRRKIYKDNAQILLISLILIFPALLAYASVVIHTSFPLEYLILIPVSSMLLTVLFDSRTGFYGTVIAALLVAGIRGNDYNVALAGLSAGAFAAYTVRDLRSRSQLFTSIGFIFLGYFIAITALSFERGTPLNELWMQLAAALGNSLISPVLTLGAVFVVEVIFDTMSDLKLSDYK